jgi:endonuclease/exonuclease/phosphatase family metal-dependent hydrolase
LSAFIFLKRKMNGLMKNWMAILILLCSQIAQSQTSLAVWTFDVLAALPNTPTSISPTANGDSQSLSAALYADGTHGSSSWKTSTSGNELTSQAGTILNDPRSPATAGTALTLANSSANGKSIVIKFSMTGLRDPVATFTLRSTTTGFSTHVWSWSTDGQSFVVADTYSTTRNSTFYLQTLDLSGINELDGAQNVYLKLTVNGASASNGNNRIDNINLTATVPALPLFNAGFPKVQSTTTDGFVGVVKLTAPGTAYFVVLENPATPPSPAQIKAQQDGNGNLVARAGSVQCLTSNVEYQFESRGLLPATNYVVFMVAENIDGLQLNPVEINVTSIPEGDHTPPSFLESPVARSFDASLVLRVSLSEPGVIYGVAVDATVAPPTITQVISGLDYQNIQVHNQTTDVPRAGVGYLLVLDDLSSSKEYDVYLVAIDTAGNIQQETTKLTANTDSTSTQPGNAFKVATYNLDFFASDVRNAQSLEFGPTDDTLQAANVAAVLKVIGADVFALQEISNEHALKEIADDIPGYEMIVSDRWSHSWQAADTQFPPQKIGFVYNSRVARLVDHEVLFSDLYDAIQAGNDLLVDYPGGDATAFWSSGRLPFTARFDLACGDVVQRIRFIVIHAKSGSIGEDYNRRVYDAKYLFDYLKTHFTDEKIILLGDFNDDVDQSVNAGAISPYQSFVGDDSNYKVLTYDLSQSGSASFPALKSFIDHVIISSELEGGYVSNSTRLIRPDGFIDNYAETTSDHFPVTATFLIKRDQSIVFQALAKKVYGDPPFVLTALAASSQPVIYTSTDPNVAAIAGNEITILKAGTAEIIASQPGDATYYPATEVSRQLLVDKASQLVTVAAVSDKVLGGSTFTLVATASSALPVSYAAESSNVSITGDDVTMLRAGRASVIVSQSGNDNYLFASTRIAFCVAPPAPVITSDLSMSTLLSSSAASGNQWFRNGSPTPGATGVELIAAQPGVYKVQVTAEDCQSIFSNEIQVAVTGVTATDDLVFRLYPNPAMQFVEVQGPAEITSVEIYNLQGLECIVPTEKHGTGMRIVVSALPPGIYLVRVSDGKKVTIGKLRKQ